MPPEIVHHSRDARRQSKGVSEQTPLLSPPPQTIEDTPREAEADSFPDDTSVGNGKAQIPEEGFNSQRNITLARAVLCGLALSCLIFLQATNISLLTTTQSKIADELDAFEQVSWFTSAYLIAMSSVSPLNGKLASVFSPGVCIFASTVILSIGAACCSVATDFGSFVLGRALTGVGASGILTISIIIVLELSSAKRRGLAIGLLNSGFTVGVAAGATVAGALLKPIGWRALFWAQIPIALVGGTVLLIAMPKDLKAKGNKPTDEKDETTLRRLARLDYLGALSLTVAIVLALYALSSPRRIPILPLILSAIVLATFVLNEVYIASDPIIPVSLLKSRGLLLTCLGTVGYMMSRWSVLFYTPIYALAVRQWTPATAGSILVPTNAGFAIGGLLVGAFHIRHHGSFYLSTVVVYTLFPITLAALALLSNQYTSPWLYVLIVFLNGAVTGAALNYTLAHLLYLTPSSTHYIATSLAATFRGFAGSFGSAIGGGVFARSLYASLEDGFAKERMTDVDTEKLIRHLLGSPAMVKDLNGVEKQVAIHGYEDALKMLWLAAAGLAVLMVFIQAGTGWKSGDKSKYDSILEQETERLAEREDASSTR